MITQTKVSSFMSKDAPYLQMIRGGVLDKADRVQRFDLPGGERTQPIICFGILSIVSFSLGPLAFE